MDEELLEEDMELLYINYLKKAKRESLEKINNLINKLKEDKMGKYVMSYELVIINERYNIII